ncbi:MAG: hypothetical protein P8176_13750 [Gammaproteobacteria bacterium]
MHTNENNADYIPDIFRPKGAGYSQSVVANIDSRLGLQVSAELTTRLSAIFQFTTEQRYNNSYYPTTEWANFKYQFTPDFSFRVGRLVQPSFLFGESRKVAYTYPWVRPPTEVYGLVPVFHYDGVDIMHRMQLGERVHSLVLSYGNRFVESPERFEGGRGRARYNFSAMSTMDYGDFTFRVSYHTTRYATAESTLFRAFRQFGPEGEAIAELYDVDGDRLYFGGFGFQYDPGKWFIMSEWGKVEYHSLLGNNTGWYISGGYRCGTVTPYVTFARLDYKNEKSDGLTVSTFPPELQEAAETLNHILNTEILGVALREETSAIGFRWDFMRSVALKLQFESIRYRDGIPRVLGLPQPGLDSSGNVKIFSSSINFVF